MAWSERWAAGTVDPSTGARIGGRFRSRESIEQELLTLSRSDPDYGYTPSPASGTYVAGRSFDPANPVRTFRDDGSRKASLIARRIEIMAREACDDALRKAAEDIFNESQLQLPVGDPLKDPDPNITLAEEGGVRKRPDGSYEVFYDTDYAVKQHEAEHFNHPRGGKAKYVEDPLKAKAATLEAEVAQEVRTRIGRRGRRE